MLQTLFAQIPIDFTSEAQTQNLIPQNVDPSLLFGNYISVILRGIMIVNVLTVFIFLIWGATEYIMASGEKSKVEEARGKMTGAIIGLIVFAATVAIYILIQGFLGVDVLRFHFGGGGGGSTSSTAGAEKVVGPDRLIGGTCYCEDSHGNNYPCHDPSLCCKSTDPLLHTYTQSAACGH